MKKLLTFLLVFSGIQGFAQKGQPIQPYGSYTKYDFLKFISNPNPPQTTKDFKTQFAVNCNDALTSSGESPWVTEDNLEEVMPYLSDSVVTIVGGYWNSYILNGKFTPYWDTRPLVEKRVIVFSYGNCRLIILKGMCLNLLNIKVNAPSKPPERKALRVADDPEENSAAPVYVTNNYYYGDTSKRDINISNVNTNNVGGYEAPQQAQVQEIIPPIYRYANNYNYAPIMPAYYAPPVPSRRPIYFSLGLNFNSGGGNYPPYYNNGGTTPVYTPGGPVGMPGWNAGTNGGNPNGNNGWPAGGGPVGTGGW